MSENIRHTGDTMRIDQLRKLAEREEIDYSFLMSALKDYSQPRDKITNWLKSGDLIRVKKGLYVFGKANALHPFSHEILANLIYGPSAISLSYALSFYGLIPEKVTLITCVTNKRHKEFNTPVGDFIYYYLQSKKYSVEIELYSISPTRQFIIASPEKALCDQMILADKALKIETLNQLETYLFQDLRIDEETFKKLHTNKLEILSKTYQNQKCNLLHQLLIKMKATQ